MKMRKKLAALLAAAMIASVMPMSAFADSTNRVVKVVTIKKGDTIGASFAPELKIKMKDALSEDLSFYLDLEGADWGEVAYYNQDVTATVATTGASITFATGSIAAGTPGFHLTDGLYGWFNSNSGNPAIATSDIDGVELNKNQAKAHLEIDSKLKAKVKKDALDPGDNVTITLKYAVPVKKMTFEANNGDFELYKENASVMAIKLTDRQTFPTDGEIVFPMISKVKDSEAFVKVRKHDTEVSNSEHLFAVSDAAKAKVVVGKTPKFFRTTEIADITIEELYANSVEGVKDGERWFTLELRDTDFTFEIGDDAKIVGERAYRGHEEKLAIADDNVTLSKDKTRLGVKINSPSVGYARERGNFVLKGINVVAARDARDSEVKAVIDSKELFKKETITIAERGDYKTKLDVPKDWKYEVVAGNQKEVKFILSEELASSLVGTRPVTFTFDQGVKINTHKSLTSKEWSERLADDILWGNTNSSYAARINALLDIAKDATKTQAERDAALAELMVEAGNLPTSPSNTDNRPGVREINGVDIITVNGKDVLEKDDGKWSDSELAKRVRIGRDYDSFTVDNFELDPDKAGQYTFTVPLLVPANVTGDIKVALAGRGVNEEEIVILKAEAPVVVDATTMDIKVGLKEIETTGKITIKETAEEKIAQGKNIVLRIDDQSNGLRIKSFKATVVEGDLVLEDRKDTDGSPIGVKRVSTEPSTIEITDIVMFTDRTVPEGKYDLVIGGNAISSLTGKTELYKNDHFDIDPVATVKDFINITTKNTEDIAGSANKAVVGFTVGADQLLVNGKAEAMDAPPYIKDGNTMVPVRYVATALGVDEDKVIWDGPNQTATIIADKVVQVKLGSKAMSVNGVSIPMDVSAELVNDRTFVPMGAIARALDVRVEWDNDTKTATFNPAK